MPAPAGPFPSFPDMTILDRLSGRGLATASAEETEAIGVELANTLPENCALALSGDLGSGKTTLVRGIALGLGIRVPVTSPTYNIYTLYQGTRQLLHMDAYRISGAHDLDSLTIEEFLRPPFLIAAEWPENIPGFFGDYITFRMEMELLADHRHGLRIL